MSHIRKTISKVVNGQALVDMPLRAGNVSIQSRYGQPWNFDEELFSSHMLTLGSIGSGKTNLLYHVVNSIISKVTEGDVLIFFDSKGDFLRRFYREGDYVIGNSQQYAGYPLTRWNIYQELAFVGSTSREDTIREIASSLFRKQMETAKDPTFVSGARDIFTALLEAQLRQPSFGAERNNATLRRTLGRATLQDIKAAVDKYPDLRWVSIYMHNEGSATTQSYLSPLSSVVHDVFAAHFAEAGEFSIRRALHERGGKSIFLEYDIVNSSLIDTVYTVLLDLASKDALGNTTQRKNAYFILDEFPLIPKLSYIDNLLNFGRSRGVKVIAGIQNINQITGKYGESLGISILSGFSTYMIFRLFDEESRRFVCARHGKNRRMIQLPYADAIESGRQEYEQGNAIEDWDLVALQNGECIISLPTGDPCRFYPTLYQNPLPEERLSFKRVDPKILIRGGSANAP